MLINLIYICTILIGIYYGIKIYIQTKHDMILWGLGIFLFSLVLELRLINQGKYITDTTDIFWKLRDILRTIVTILGFRLAYRLKDLKSHQTKTK